ncbi:nitrate- and nitrite sensing domain-containing protein [Orrella sp. JC864]|uniref:nitrate regulatory protein n=1 Tax=Orrella sp. JC864 TaxID=3120298 RepID=UPI00300968EC
MTEAAMPAALRLLLAARRKELQDLRDLLPTCELVARLAQAIHALQKERGYSNLHLQGLAESERAGPLPLDERHAQSDAFLARALQALARLESGAGGRSASARLLNRAAHLCYLLEDLPRLRRRVREHGIDTQQSVHAYTRLIGAMLTLVFEAADSGLDPGITQALAALLNFMQGKELCGQERAEGVLGFAAGYFDADRKARMQQLAAAQARCFEVFCQYADSQAAGRWRAAQAQAGDMQRLRRMIPRTSAAQPTDPALAQVWFDVLSAHIDALHGIEAGMAAALPGLCEQRLAQAQADLDDHRRLLARCAQESAEHGAPLLFGIQGSTLDATSDDAAPGPRIGRSLLDLLQAQTLRLQQLDAELARARSSLDERRRLERARRILMQRHGMDEQGAHEALQKAAMDSGLRLEEVVARLLREQPGAPQAG